MTEYAMIKEKAKGYRRLGWRSSCRMTGGSSSMSVSTWRGRIQARDPMSPRTINVVEECTPLNSRPLRNILV